MSDANIIWNEVNKVNAGVSRGQQAIMVEMEMQDWANKVKMSPDSKRKDIIDAHALARGWKQSNVDGMQLIY
ncbi:hypothetical protein N9I00_01125 [bacterium]|nr:hypothetical protein [bacterium]